MGEIFGGHADVLVHNFVGAQTDVAGYEQVAAASPRVIGGDGCVMNYSPVASSAMYASVDTGISSQHRDEEDSNVSSSLPLGHWAKGGVDARVSSQHRDEDGSYISSYLPSDHWAKGGGSVNGSTPGRTAAHLTRREGVAEAEKRLQHVALSQEQTANPDRTEFIMDVEVSAGKQGAEQQAMEQSRSPLLSVSTNEIIIQQHVQRRAAAEDERDRAVNRLATLEYESVLRETQLKCDAESALAVQRARSAECEGAWRRANHELRKLLAAAEEALEAEKGMAGTYATEPKKRIKKRTKRVKSLERAQATIAEFPERIAAAVANAEEETKSATLARAQ